MKSAQPGKMLMMTFTLSLSSCEYYSAWAPSEITNTADKAQVGVCEDWILGRSVIPMVVIWHNQQPCHWSEMQNQNESKWYMIYDFIYIIIYILWSFNNDQKKDDSRLHQAADSTKASIFSRCKVRFWPPSRKSSILSLSVSHCFSKSRFNLWHDHQNIHHVLCTTVSMGIVGIQCCCTRCEAKLSLPQRMLSLVQLPRTPTWQLFCHSSLGKTSLVRL